MAAATVAGGKDVAAEASAEDGVGSSRPGKEEEDAGDKAHEGDFAGEDVKGGGDVVKGSM